MDLNHANVFVCSMVTLDNTLKYYGDANILDLNLLKLIYKYAEFTEESATLIRLDAMVSQLQHRSKIICMDKTTGAFYPDYSSPFGSESDTIENTPPTLNNGAVTLSDSAVTHLFTSAEFAVSFADADGDGVGDLVILTLPATGVLAYNGTAVVANQIFTVAQLSSGAQLGTGLVYTRNGVGAETPSFTFLRMDDHAINPAPSTTKTMALTVTALANVAATIGDEHVYTDNAVTTVLTEAVLAPSYADGDADALHSIRIDEISDENIGAFEFLGAPIIVGDIITKAQLDGGDFVHIGPSQFAVNTDVINFSVRDVGSLIWVS